MGIGKLMKFIEAWNNGGRLPLLTRELVEEHVNNAAESFVKQFDAEVQLEANNKIIMRASMLGYPAVELAARKIYETKTGRVPISRQWIFHLGDYFESLILTLMEAYGLSVQSKQAELKYETPEGHVLTGHIDAVVEGILIDIKTMSFYYAKQFAVSPNDDRGYITQLNIYRSQIECEGSGFLCLDKSSNNLFFVENDEDPRYLQRVNGVADALAKIEEFEQIKEHFDIPPLEPDSNNPHKKVVPQSMRYSQYVKLFYVFDAKGNPVSTAW